MTNLENELKIYFDCNNELKSINDRLDGIKTESRNIINNKFEVYKNGSDDEINKLKSDFDKLDNEEKLLRDRRTTVLMKIEFVKNNLDFLFFQEYMPKVIEIWNGYAGKKIGPKTAEKLKNEIKEKVGINVYWSWEHSYHTMRLLGSFLGYQFRIEVSPKWENGKFPYSLLDVDNKACILSMDKLKISQNNNKYVQDIDEIVQELRQIWKKCEDKKRELEGMISEYNSMCIGNIPHLNLRDSYFREMG